MRRQCKRLLGAALLAMSIPTAHAETIRIGGTGAGLGLLRILGESFGTTRPGVVIEIAPNLGSSGGISAVRDEAIDLGISGRPLSAKEISPRLREQTFVESPFLFVSSHPKPQELTLADVAHMYRGTTTTWPDGSPVRVILRPKSDAAALYMAARLDGMASAVEAARGRPEIMVAPTDQDNMELANRLGGSLTVMTLVQLNTEPHKLRPVLVNGHNPGTQDGANPKYPYRYKLYLIARAQPSAATQDLMTFIHSEQAAGIMRRHGGIPSQSD